MPGDHFRSFTPLEDDLKARHPAIGWKQMAAAGNVYPTTTKTWRPIL
jgi:hypothetical protein